MSNFEQLLDSLTPEIYQRLVTAVELGKWPDGVVIEKQQIELLLQVTIAYSAKNNLNAEELFSVDSSGGIIDGTIFKKAFSEKNEIPINLNNTNNKS